MKRETSAVTRAEKRQNAKKYASGHSQTLAKKRECVVCSVHETNRKSAP